MERLGTPTNLQLAKLDIIIVLIYLITPDIVENIAIVADSLRR
jgi:hypothetical protein